MFGRGQGRRYVKWLREMAYRDLVVMKRKQENLTLGYVTSDVCVLVSSLSFYIINLILMYEFRPAPA